MYDIFYLFHGKKILGMTKTSDSQTKTEQINKLQNKNA
jgi:hypothetical protein